MLASARKKCVLPVHFYVIFTWETTARGQLTPRRIRKYRPRFTRKSKHLCSKRRSKRLKRYKVPDNRRLHPRICINAEKLFLSPRKTRRARRRRNKPGGRRTRSTSF